MGVIVLHRVKYVRESVFKLTSGVSLCQVTVGLHRGTDGDDALALIVV